MRSETNTRVDDASKVEAAKILDKQGKKFLIQKVDGNTIFMEEIDDG